jgi:pantoate--beta-alanine ligase
MRILTSARDLAQFSSGVFVPTMGALHEGHFALVRDARRRADLARAPVVVSVFVNPTQFNDPKDLDRYPRTLGADAAGCQRAGADALYAPHVQDIYPPNEPVPVPPLPPVATQPGLEDAHRPGHFAGVVQVVSRLFSLVRPRAAIFGEKDWQQLRVIAAMSATLHPDIDIVPGPTVREPDGLAMSSRNVFLSPDDRAIARALSAALRAAQSEPTPTAAEDRMRRILLDAPVASIEYAVVRDAETLARPDPARPARALIAARVGAVRLIDNAPWPGESRRPGWTG